MTIPIKLAKIQKSSGITRKNVIFFWIPEMRYLLSARKKYTNFG